jgi:hypothetical protein
MRISFPQVQSDFLKIKYHETKRKFEKEKKNKQPFSGKIRARRATASLMVEFSERKKKRTRFFNLREISSPSI